MKSPDISSDEKYAIAERIRNEREKRGFTQEAFANILDITLSGYKKIESAENNISINTLVKLHQLNIPADYILFGKKQNMDDVWSMVENCNEHDKMLVFVRLMSYFLKTKDKFYENLNDSKSLDDLIAKLLEEIDN